MLNRRKTKKILVVLQNSYEIAEHGCQSSSKLMEGREPDEVENVESAVRGGIAREWDASISSRAGRGV